ncbi:cell cycle regulator of non-homologous end joining isoform X2 [Phyllostomus discolor]|uniref:Cell cycle regulator of non-homologous end joining isoform X2 n=1 Tax=Phyllostomus discolor TaxID=89673 RepID=A0A6J2MVM7_9CHIR|nr:cell cycle regulator of non-homologous end joining isoform X2 [Phyllostomus discolor]
MPYFQTPRAVGRGWETLPLPPRPMPVSGHKDGSLAGALRMLLLSSPAGRPRDVALLLSCVLARPEGRLSPWAAPCLSFRPPAVKTVYCMNEAELVDVALGVLIQSRKQEKALEQLPLAGTDKPALSPTCPESPSSGSGSEAEDHGRGAFHSGPSPPGGPQGSGRACSRSPEEEEEDAFKYVREIFFS